MQIGKLIQNVFTSAKTLSLVAVIFIGLLLARNAEAIRANFSDFWTPHGVTPIKPDLSVIATVSATAGAFGLFVAFCVAQVGSLFSSVAWENVTFTAGEVKEPRRNIPLSLAAGTGLVTLLYVFTRAAPNKWARQKPNSYQLRAACRSFSRIHDQFLRFFLVFMKGSFLSFRAVVGG